MTAGFFRDLYIAGGEGRDKKSQEALHKVMFCAQGMFWIGQRRKAVCI